MLAPPSGQPSLDGAQGGLRPEGSYLLQGEDLEAARLSALRLAQTISGRGEVCVFTSAAPPADLARLADRLGFDLAEAARAETFRMLRVPGALRAEGLADARRARAFADLASQVCSHSPALFVLDDPTAIARFDAPEALASALDTLRKRLAAAAVPFALTLPANHPLAARIGTFTPASTTATLPPASPASPTTTTSLHAPRSESDGANVSAAEFEFLDLSATRTRPAEVDGGALGALEYAHFVASDSMDRPASGSRPSARAPLGLADRYPGDVPSAAALLDTDLFRQVEVEGALSAFEGPAMPEPRPDPYLAFAWAFDEARTAHERGVRPFLVVALRMPPGHPAARHFPLLLQALDQTLGAENVRLADEERCRVAWLMPDASRDAALPLLETLAHVLRDALPRADYVLRTTSVALLPNGRPFTEAAELFAYVFETV